MMTKQERVLEALRKGEELTAAQIKARFGVKNPTATVSDIRNRGYAIYATQRVAGNGVQVTEYAHGHASRKLIAAGYKAMAMGLV